MAIFNSYVSLPEDISLLTNEWLETPQLPIFSDPSWSWYRRLAESRLKRLSAQLLVSKGPGKMLEFTKKTWSKCRFSQRKHVFFKPKKEPRPRKLGFPTATREHGPWQVIATSHQMDCLKIRKEPHSISSCFRAVIFPHFRHWIDGHFGVNLPCSHWWNTPMTRWDVEILWNITKYP